MPHPIVDEELALLARVSEVLEAAPSQPTPSEAPIVRDLERIREQLVSGRESKDEMALTEQ